MRAAARARLSNFARREDGAALAEFALVLPLFVLMAAGLTDGSRLISQAMQIKAAAHAAALYAQANSWNVGQTSAAAAAATSLPVTVTLPALPMAGCLTSNGVVASTTTCPDGAPPGSFVTISVAAKSAFQPTFSWLGVWPKAPLSATATVRVG